MKREIYELTLNGLKGTWIVRDWPNYEKVKIEASITIVEELIGMAYPKGYFRSYAKIYLIAEKREYPTYEEYMYTFSNKPEFRTEDVAWIIGEGPFKYLNENLSGIVDHILKKKTVLLSGSYSEKSLEIMSKAAKFLGYDKAIAFTPTSGDPNIDKTYWRKVFNAILNDDISAIFMFIGKNQSIPSLFRTVEDMAFRFDIPVYRKEEYEEMVLEKVLGGDQKDAQSDDNSNGSNDGSNSHTRIYLDGSGIVFN